MELDDLAPDPIEQFGRLWTAAKASESFDADRAAIASVDAEGRPSVRFVLVREFGADGFVFYTDYRSRKSQQLLANPHGALAWHWASTGVQVRVEGPVRRASAERSDAYFGRRPRGSRVGAWASHQSAPIATRADLESEVRKVEARFEGDVPRPEHWGGFVVEPRRIEFWFNGENRLHDRFVFERDGDGWKGLRVAP